MRDTYMQLTLLRFHPFAIYTINKITIFLLILSPIRHSVIAHRQRPNNVRSFAFLDSGAFARSENNATVLYRKFAFRN